METHPELHAPHLNDYIQGGDSKPEAIFYWPWATAEYRALLEWMREYNREQPVEKRILFHGIDPQTGDRDRAMAENVAAIVEEFGGRGEGVIVWAANSHIRGALGGMGEHLREWLGDEVYLLGLEFHEGEFTSRAGAVRTYSVGPFPESYYTHSLAQLPGSIRFLDFRNMSEDSVVKAWLYEPRLSNHLFEMYTLTRFLAPLTKVREPWPALFDGVIYIEQSTPPTPLPRAPAG